MKKWTLAKFGQEDVLMYDGVISAISLEEICNKLNDLEQINGSFAQSYTDGYNKGYNDGAYNEIKK